MAGKLVPTVKHCLTLQNDGSPDSPTAAWQQLFGVSEWFKPSTVVRAPWQGRRLGCEASRAVACGRGNYPEKPDSWWGVSRIQTHENLGATIRPNHGGLGL